MIGALKHLVTTEILVFLPCSQKACVSHRLGVFSLFFNLKYVVVLHCEYINSCINIPPPPKKKKLLGFQKSINITLRVPSLLFSKEKKINVLIYLMWEISQYHISVHG